MKNIVFISPNFPTNYWKFCLELKNNGMNVLGVGDQPYDELTTDQKNSMTEYYKVDSLENYDSVYRAVAFFTFKYGRIDWIESNNEYWLEKDAKLRDDFNIASGFRTKDMPRIKYKSKMKEYYKAAGIPVARYYLVKTLKGCERFINKVGYPVVAKPDNGVGASHTFKISNHDELESFFAQKHEDAEYIMEEFIHAEINSYDAIIDSNGDPIFEAGNVTPGSLMDVVNNADNSIFYIVKELADDTREFGRKTVKSFGVKSRFVHLEFFRLLSDHEGLGKKGDLMALEVNMRPSGGVTPDMINFARNTDVYKIWADMIAFDRTEVNVKDHFFCGFAGLRRNRNYKLSRAEVLEKYAGKLRMNEDIPDALAPAMGNYFYIGAFDTREELYGFFADVTAESEDK